MKTGNLIINWLLLSYAICHTERLFSPFDKWKQKGTSKIPIFHHFYELGKIWKYTPKSNISKSMVESGKATS